MNQELRNSCRGFRDNIACEATNTPTVLTEDGSISTYASDADLSVEYGMSIEIRGPPEGQIVNSDTWIFSTSASNNNLTLRPIDDWTALELSDNHQGVLLAKHSLEEITQVVIQGLENIVDIGEDDEDELGYQ